MINATMWHFQSKYGVLCLEANVPSLHKVSRSCKSTGAMLDTVDACSLLYRLQMEGEAESPLGLPKALQWKRPTGAFSFQVKRGYSSCHVQVCVWRTDGGSCSRSRCLTPTTTLRCLTTPTSSWRLWGRRRRTPLSACWRGSATWASKFCAVISPLHLRSPPLPLYVTGLVCAVAWCSHAQI